MANYYDMSDYELMKIVAKNEIKIAKREMHIAGNQLYSQAVYNYEAFAIPKDPQNMTRGELIHTIYRQNKFFSNETSTVKGTYRVTNETRKTLKGMGINATNKNVGHIFKIYDQIAEKDPSLSSYKYDIVKDIASKVKANINANDIIKNAKRMLEEIYINTESIDNYDDFENVVEEEI